MFDKHSFAKLVRCLEGPIGIMETIGFFLLAEPSGLIFLHSKIHRQRAGSVARILGLFFWLILNDLGASFGWRQLNSFMEALVSLGR